ncbi:MAG TPA: SDR family oxidoreductase [Gemmatimonadaceae bacterium]|nr:SDR family oxidoreductase [Gemmatimonadaceae bacterium]
MTLQDRHIVIAGGSSGIGLGVARAALAAGARVTIAARTAERLDRAREQLRAEGHDPARVRSVVADISREGDVVHLFEETGPLDHLVATAVSVAYLPVAELDLAAAQRVIDSKLIGPLLLAKHGSRRIRSGGSITFTSGINAYRPAPGGSVVSATNGALEALGRALAVELAPIRVNVVSPGWVDTPVWDSFAGARKAEVLAGMAARLPVGRTGTTEDLAQGYLFLMQNEYSTGTVLHVDGGQRLV